MRFIPANIKNHIIGALLASLVFVAGMTAVTHRAYAQTEAAAANSVQVSDILNYPNQFFLKLKGSSLDSIAYAIAKSVLHQMVGSVVNWINSGFKGNPAFVTNPTAYFLNAADNATAQFLSNGGPLSSLCSPYSVDIRLSLALGQVQAGQANGGNRYACTLGTIISNASNASVSVNGTSINGFLGGDFSQGGWPAFIALTTEPQNNEYGAYLQAQSDLNASIGSSQSSINADLNRGGGFLSYQSCQDVVTAGPDDTVTASQLGLSQPDFIQLQNAGSLSNASGDFATKQVADPNGGTDTVYQTCSVQTPGSVINSSLNKALGSSVDELISVHDFNEIASALFSQLVTQVLSNGLHASSGGSGAGNQTQSIVNQLTAEQTGAGSALQIQQQQLLSNINPYLTQANQYEQTEQQALTAVTEQQTAYQTVSMCLSTQTSQDQTASGETDGSNASDESASSLAEQAAAVSTTLNTTIGPAVASYQANINRATNELNELQSLSSAITGAQTVTDLQEPSTEFSDLVVSNTLIQPTDVQNAQTDLTNAQASAANLQTGLAAYQSLCPSSASPTVTPP